MKFSVFIILSLLVLLPSIAVAEVYGTQTGIGYFQTMDSDSFVVGFLKSYYAEITSLSIAAVAAIGLQLSLKKYSKFGDDKSINTLTVIVFIAMFLMIYSAGLYSYFIPFIGYLVLTGIGVLIWGVYKGLNESKMEPFDKLVGAGGAFFLSWFAYMSGLFFASIILGVFGVLLILYALPSLDKLGLSFGGKGGKGGRGDGDVVDVSEGDSDVKGISDGSDYSAELDSVKSSVSEALDSLKEAGESLSKLLSELKEKVEGVSP